MTLNDRQLECLRTCMPSCWNVAYPSLGLVEELGEYIEKLLPIVEWSPDYPDRAHLEMLLKGIVHNARCIAAISKQVRHKSIPVPFVLKSSLGNGDPTLYQERITAIRQELGDISWMLNVTDFFIVNQPELDRVKEQSADIQQAWENQSFVTCVDSLDGQSVQRKKAATDAKPDKAVTVHLVPTAATLACLNREKLEARRKQGTIDGRGDNARAPIE